MDPSHLQKTIKSRVDSYLKGRASEYLKFSKVSVRRVDGGFRVDVKIVLEKPMPLSIVSNLVAEVFREFGANPSTTLIYSPHSRAIRLTFTVKA